MMDLILQRECYPIVMPVEEQMKRYFVIRTFNRVIFITRFQGTWETRASFAAKGNVNCSAFTFFP